MIDRDPEYNCPRGWTMAPREHFDAPPPRKGPWIARVLAWLFRAKIGSKLYSWAHGVARNVEIDEKLHNYFGPLG